MKGDDLVLMIFILSVLLIIMLLTRKKHLKYSIVACTLVLIVVAAQYVPTEETDLKRYYDIIGYVKDGGWAVFDQFSYTKNLYLFRALFYFLGSINAEKLLPIITVVICYFVYMEYLRGVLLGIECKNVPENRKNNALKKALCFYIAVVPFYNVICGVRFWICCSVLLIILYEDIVNKRNCIVCFALYLILTQFHTCAFIFIGLRIFLIFFERMNRMTRIIAGLILVFYQPIVMVLYTLGFFNLFGSSVGNLVYRFQFYLNATHVFSFTKYVGPILNIVFAVWVLKKAKKKYGKQLNSYYVMMVYIVCFTIGAYYNFDLLYRFSYIAIFMSIPLQYLIFINKKSKKLAAFDAVYIAYILFNFWYNMTVGGYNLIFV